MNISKVHKLSTASQLSLLSIVILMGALFFTVTNALQQQQQGGHAANTSAIIVTIPSCIVAGHTGSDVKIYWTYANIIYVDISKDARFPVSSLYHKKIIRGRHSSTGPDGFLIANGSNNLKLDPGKKYYVRTWNGSSHSPLVSFSIPSCQTINPTLLVPTATITCSPPPQCFRNGVLICLLPVDGWCNMVPTSSPTGVLSSTPTMPKPTFPPGSTLLNFIVGLHGIGTGGDSANPNSQGNVHPLRRGRAIVVDIYDAQNQLVINKQGTVLYDDASGKFNGTVNLGGQFATGLYTVKVKSDQYLRAIVPGIQTITQGQVTTLPVVTLVVGDINGDNAINIIDYNILVGCYSDLLPAADCTASNKVLADLNDDGDVNMFDYNLFLRELTNIGGQ